jgi:hypothetical protein
VKKKRASRRNLRETLPLRTLENPTALAAGKPSAIGYRVSPAYLAEGIRGLHIHLASNRLRRSGTGVGPALHLIWLVDLTGSAFHTYPT